MCSRLVLSMAWELQTVVLTCSVEECECSCYRIHRRLTAHEVEKLMTGMPSMSDSRAQERVDTGTCGEAKTCCIERVLVRKAVLTTWAELLQQSCRSKSRGVALQIDGNHLTMLLDNVGAAVCRYDVQLTIRDSSFPSVASCRTMRMCQRWIDVSSGKSALDRDHMRTGVRLLVLAVRSRPFAYRLDSGHPSTCAACPTHVSMVKH